MVFTQGLALKTVCECAQLPLQIISLLSHLLPHECVLMGVPYCACVRLCICVRTASKTHCFLQDYILGQLFAHYFPLQPEQFNLH